jgi:hypothetical protein
MTESEFAARLRALGESRDQGVISEEEFARAKQRLLSSRPVPATRQSETEIRNLQILGYAFIAIAVSLICSVFFSTWSFFDFQGSIDLTDLLPLVSAAGCGLVGVWILQRKTICNEVYLAIPLMLGSLIIPFYSFLSHISLATLYNIGCLVQVLATIVALVVLSMSWKRHGWSLDRRVTPDLIISAVGSLFLIIFIFVDAWTYDSTYKQVRTFSDVGSMWSDSSIWLMLGALGLIVAFVFPTLVVLSGDKRKIAFSAAGSVLVALGVWLPFFQRAMDDFYGTTGKVAIVIIGVAAMAGLGVMQLLNIHNHERSIK